MPTRGRCNVTNEAKPHVYDVLAKTFIHEGVSTCFTLMGDANMNWAARLAQQGCRMVFVRHEHCAVGAAMACGPGGHRRGSAREIVRSRCAAIRSVTSEPATVAEDQPITNAGGRPATVTSTSDSPSSTLASALTAATTPADQPGRSKSNGSAATTGAYKG